MDDKLREFLATAYASGMLTAENALRLLMLNFNVTEDEAVFEYASFQLEQDKEYRALGAKANKLREKLEEMKEHLEYLRGLEVQEAVTMLTSDDYSDGSWKAALRKSKAYEARVDVQGLRLRRVEEDLVFRHIDACSRARKDLLGE